MGLTIQILYSILSTSWASASISGLSYQDPIPQKPLPGENPCNPLYWYPRVIPEYCYNKITPKTVKTIPAPNSAPPPHPLPLPPMMPMPVPPIAVPMPYPPPMPIMPPLPILPSAGQFLPPLSVPYGFLLPPPVPQTVPYGPISPTNPLPVPVPYHYPPMLPPRSRVGLVPGIEGLVSSDGGINILPFSDAYSDMLEKHKQKMIRKRLQKVLDDYDEPRRKKYRKFRGRYLSFEE